MPVSSKRSELHNDSLRRYPFKKEVALPLNQKIIVFLQLIV